jgi:E3 ubiquitin-protein ligase RNF38/44
MAAVVHRLPLEEFRTRAELAALPVAELRALLAARGGAAAAAAARACLEKGELAAAAAAAGGGGNSAAAACAICCEDYASGDVLRALRCGHRFHCECLDRWLIQATDFSRPVACPLCNAPVEPAP